jgi:hypothetical protein
LLQHNNFSEKLVRFVMKPIVFYLKMGKKSLLTQWDLLQTLTVLVIDFLPTVELVTVII